MNNKKKWLLDALQYVVDIPFNNYGFSRNDGATIYYRKRGNARQAISFSMDSLSSRVNSADAHIHPMFQVEISNISKIALQFVGGDKTLLANAPEIIVNEPIVFAAPKEEHCSWYVKSEDEFVRACENILIFIERWVFAFLDELVDAKSLIKLNASNDARLLKQKHYYIFLAAAYELIGERHNAKEVILKEFSKPLYMRKYRSVFEALDIECIE